MASVLTRKKACSSTTIVHVILLLLMLITLMASFTWLENYHKYKPRGILFTHYNLNVDGVNYISRVPRDYDHHPKKLMLEMDSDPTPAGISCDRSHFRYDLCLINGQAILDPTESTLYSIGPTRKLEKVKPYPRKWENVMAKIKDVKLRTGPIGQKCAVHHNSPALVFSVGGHTGNFFHDFNDGILPIFITLNNLSMVERDVILVIDNARDWWVHKYADIIRAFTKHPIISLENEILTHCFPRAFVGLISHGYMTIDQNALPGIRLVNFHSFLRKALYSHEVGPTLPNPKWGQRRRPKLIWLDRTGSIGRVILNQEKACLVAEEVGFDVIMFHPTKSFPLRKAYEIVSMSHAMIGVHGASLTHMLFLRKGSVVVQGLPLGLEQVGQVCFRQAAREVGLEYMEYKLWYDESSLPWKYRKENPILKDPQGFLEKNGWDQELLQIYLREQDVKLDLVRFRVYMEKVYKKARYFMDKHG